MDFRWSCDRAAYSQTFGVIVIPIFTVFSKRDFNRQEDLGQLRARRHARTSQLDLEELLPTDGKLLSLRPPLFLGNPSLSRALHGRA